jgi:regulator of protease activity HflC (stomatin/prohibitin superfamily)
MISEGEPYGVKIIRTEIKEIDPVGPVKAAIEDKIAAEKERQAMILRADGRKRALIMEREGRG